MKGTLQFYVGIALAYFVAVVAFFFLACLIPWSITEVFGTTVIRGYAAALLFYAVVGSVVWMRSAGL